MLERGLSRTRSAETELVKPQWCDRRFLTITHHLAAALSRAQRTLVIDADWSRASTAQRSQTDGLNLQRQSKHQGISEVYSESHTDPYSAEDLELRCKLQAWPTNTGSFSLAKP